MKKRPQIKVGDIVKLAKRARDYNLPSTATMRVVRIVGDGIDRASTVYVLYKSYEYSFKRNELWKTGYNIDNENEDLELSIDAPLNNNGRQECYLCGMPTKTVVLFVTEHQVCNNINCKWFEN